MVVLVRFSYILPRHNSARRTDQLSGEPHASEIKKFVGSTSSRSFNTHGACIRSKTVLPEPDYLRSSSQESTCLDALIQKYHGTVLEHFSVHQIQSKSLAPTVATALMLSTPVEALAETCEPDKSVFNMPLLLFVALVGAAVGGLLAQQRKGELKRVNEQQLQINAALRRQAKIESYAPALSYALIGARILENEVIVDPKKHNLISCLKNGKYYLRNQDPKKAFLEFKTALELAQNHRICVLRASLQQQGKYREAIKHQKRRRGFWKHRSLWSNR